MPQTFKFPIHPREVVRGKRKLFTAAAKASYKETGEYFQKHLRPRRFTKQHAQLAGYQPRSKKYMKRKMREMGHDNPLEFSGEAKAASARFRMSTVAGTKAGGAGGYAKLYYAGLRKLNYRPYMADEFRRVIPQELQILGDEFDKTLDKKLSEG